LSHIPFLTGHRKKKLDKNQLKIKKYKILKKERGFKKFNFLDDS
jgi:hypothetical protein